MMMKIKASFFLNDIHACARSLLGSILVRQLPSGNQLKGRIVEVEVYTQENDPAAHSYKGRNKRNTVMFGPPGHLYVYFTYGMHFCCNIVCGPEGRGDAILIRAVVPLEGIEDMMRHRYGSPVHDKKKIANIANGPAKLCKAFSITTDDNGTDLMGDDIWLETGPDLSADRIASTSRIGISRGKEHLWRYYIKDCAEIATQVEDRIL